MQPPETNLTPGQTGSQVQQLQQWLMELGYLSQADYNTGPGTYGPKTTAAVLKLQQQLGVNNSSGPGYWGPLTLAAVDKTFGYGGTPTKPTTSTQTPTPPTAPPTSLAQSIVSTAINQATNLANQGNTGITLAQALQSAATDPNLMAKYADSFNIDKQAFQQALHTYQAQAQSQASQQSLQFQDDRKKLAEQSAAAGQAYSGFRGQAQKDLAQQESAVIQSTTAQNQSQLQNLVRQFESQYGSGTTPNASISYADPLQGMIGMNGQLSGGSGTTDISAGALGGITGSQTISKQQDITSLAGQYYNLGQTIPAKPLQ